MNWAGVSPYRLVLWPVVDPATKWSVPKRGLLVRFSGHFRPDSYRVGGIMSVMRGFGASRPSFLVASRLPVDAPLGRRIWTHRP